MQFYCTNFFIIFVSKYEMEGNNIFGLHHGTFSSTM
ncbi:Uncharacterised protein [Sphingobacterium thalpophilum]|uniref:Uncharacterized protein n=1 Tax=Sphingobacterium thalpophilum TaxID=259 RepID=A0A4U9VKD7_9SPHI|nr:Uncharacterised protein [Sphingobacterium thalpophilum]